MLALTKGRYRARAAETDADLRRAQALRFTAFRGQGGGAASGLDRDRFDEICTHVLIEETASGDLAAAFRLLHLPEGGRGIGKSYSAQHYGLAALESYEGPMAEMGRFCIRPGPADPDILRVAWGALTEFVDRAGVTLLFGCSSFRGTDPSAYRDAFALLQARHLAPARWRPEVRAAAVVRFGDVAGGPPDLRRAQAAMPPLLRSYLLMGGWVSDHAVVDRDLDTLHVFTGLDVGAVPPARARVLRGLSAG